jgi:dipeptidase E
MIGEIIWGGLGFVEFSIAPHYRSAHPESEEIEKVVKYFEENNMPYRALHDGEVLVINGADVRLVK